MTENIPPSDAGAMDLVLTCIRMAARDTNLYSFARADRGPLPSAEPAPISGSSCRTASNGNIRWFRQTLS